MDLPDIFTQISLRVDDETLSKLVLPQFWDVMKPMLEKNSFWYERSQQLLSDASIGHSLRSRPDVEWRRVYYTLSATIEGSDKIWRNLDYLPSISVLEEVFGVPNWEEDDQEYVWREIKTPEVLTRLLELKYIKPSVSSALACLHTAAREGREQMIDPLLTIIEEQVDEEELSFDEGSDTIIEIESCTRDAARAGHLSIVKLLVDYGDDEDNDLIEAAIEGGHLDVVAYVLDRYEYGKVAAAERAVEYDKSNVLEYLIDKYELGEAEIMDSLFDRAIEHGSMNSIKLLLSRGVVVEEDFDWGSLLENAIEHYQVEFAEYILKKDKNVKITSKMLERASKRGSDMLAVLLRDPRSNPGPSATIILEKSRDDIQETTALLLNDKRVEIDNLQLRDVQLMLSKPNKRMEDRMKGFVLGNTIARSHDQVFMSNLWTRAGESNIHSLLLRFILLRSPTAIELMNWMIEKRDKHLQEAAHSVIEDRVTADTRVWARALMLCVLYPTLSLEDLLDDIRAEGASYNEIVRAGQLVGSYLGESGIRSRDEKSR